jgi:hypothetical protein
MGGRREGRSSKTLPPWGFPEGLYVARRRFESPVALEARIGILKDRLVVEGVEYPLRREGGGWVSVPSVGRRSAGRVRYDSLRDRIRIDGPCGPLTIQFRWRHTWFEFSGHRYQVGPMVWGHIMVSRDDRPLITGRVTLSGVRLGYVAPELESIAPQLAVGLAFRAIMIWVAAGTTAAVL